MEFRVQEFRAAMNFDGARPNLFQLELTFPTLVGGAQQQFTFMARASELPGDFNASVSAYYFGRELKFAGNRTFPDWTFTIINDEDMQIRRAFEVWMSGINSHAGNLRNPSFIKGDGGYQSDGYVTHFGKVGDAIKRYKMIGCFPTEVSPIGLDWGANDQIEEYSVTLAYQWWESDTTDTVGSTGAFSPLLPPIA